MFEDFKEKIELETLPETVDFKNTNYVISLAVFLSELILSENNDDMGYERFELEAFIVARAPKLQEPYFLIFNQLFMHNFTVSAKTLDEYILHLKMSAIYHKISSKNNETDT